MEGHVTGTDLYRIRDFVGDFDAITKEFVARSLSLSARAKMRTDIAYGTRARETLDLIFPDDMAADAPLHVFVHGGYWRSGEKADYRFVAEPALAAGAITAVVEYDLMPGQRLGVLVDQVRRALLWLEHHAPEFGADPARITVSGHSAGAHLSSYLAASGPQETQPPALPRLKGLLLLSGIYDLVAIPDSFLKDEAEMTHMEAAAWTPLSSLQMDRPHRVIAYGSDETAPFIKQAAALQDKLASSQDPAELLRVSGHNHMSVVLDLGDSDGVLGGRLADLVSSQ
jgi:arylformamidase